jgi:hypothetical protein
MRQKQDGEQPETVGRDKSVGVVGSLRARWGALMDTAAALWAAPRRLQDLEQSVAELRHMMVRLEVLERDITTRLDGEMDRMRSLEQKVIALQRATDRFEPLMHGVGELHNIKSRVDLLELSAVKGLDSQGASLADEIFDERFYLKANPDVAKSGQSPLDHYMKYGRVEGRKPSAIFDPRSYIEANPEVGERGWEPLLHYALVGRLAGAAWSRAETISPRPEITRDIASEARRLIVFFTSGSNFRSGGILSITAIYEETKNLASLHGASVAMCVVPTEDPAFLKYDWFENNNYLLDPVALLRSCKKLDYLQLHIPEYIVGRVSAWLDDVSTSLFKSVSEVHLNVMLQNIDLIQRVDVASLRRFGRVTVTTAHEAYGNAATRDLLGVTLHKLSVRFGPELYTRRPFKDKEPILVVSPDEHPLRDQVLQTIASAMPDLDIRVIENMAYDDYKELIGRAKWSLTFGEGLDGYFAEPIFCGGNSFAVYNDRFFTPPFAALETVYASWEQLIENITTDMRRLDEEAVYNRCCDKTYELLASMYSTEKFRENLRAFYRGEYTFP